MKTLIENNGFTNDTLGWKAWVDVVDCSTATRNNSKCSR